MSTTTNRGSLADCFEYLDQALDSTIGVRIPCPNAGQANHLRTRLHTARRLSRNEHDAVEDRGWDHPKYQTCPYDTLIIKIREKPEGKWFVYIEHRKVGNVEILETDEWSATGENTTEPTQTATVSTIPASESSVASTRRQWEKSVGAQLNRPFRSLKL